MGHWASGVATWIGQVTRSYFLPVDKLALTLSLVWKGHVRTGSREFINRRGLRGPGARNCDQRQICLSDATDS
jgi:hypothetical protein